MLVVAVGIVGAAAYAGSVASKIGLREFWPTLDKPWYTPPDAVFGIVWSIVYVLMIFSLWRVLIVWWTSHPRERAVSSAGQHALIAQLVQIFLNGLWSWVFFAWGMAGWGLVEIVLLWACIGWAMATTSRISPAGAFALVPYHLWVGFAAVLNAGVWSMNRG